MSWCPTFDVFIDAAPSRVWRALTSLDELPRWMGEAEMNVTVETTWALGSPIVIRGFHHAPFENRGVVQAFEPDARLRYTHVSSISPSKHETTLEFTLTAQAHGTALTLTLSGAPTYVDAKHLEFYWRGTVLVLKRVVEGLRAW